MAEKQSKEQEEIEIRARLFDKEFQELQRKYQFKVVAQHVWPSQPGTQPAITTVPIILIPIVGAGKQEKSNITDPTK